MLSGNIKLGSSGEYVIKAISSKVPEKKINRRKIYAIRFMAKLSNKLAVFLISINESI